MNELTEIANNCRTDKGTDFREKHAYTEFYYDYFKKFKNKKDLKILEIGVWHGGSLKMFNEFFEHNCEIYAIDIDYSLNEYTEDNVHLYTVDQNNKSQIENFLNEIGNIKFDIILDDGSHQLEHQFHSLLYLYKYVKPNGIYVLEDLHTYVWDNDNSQSPLYFLLFHNYNKYLDKNDIDELNLHIDNVTINSKENKNNPYAGYSITSIITFK